MTLLLLAGTRGWRRSRTDVLIPTALYRHEVPARPSM
jgi:hypothetical protein